MAQTLPNGVVVPNADGEEAISETGVQEMRTLGASVDTALVAKANIATVNAQVAAADFTKGTLPSGSDIFQLESGVHMLGGANHAATMINMPGSERKAGPVIVSKTDGYGWREIVYAPTGVDYYWRAVTAPTQQNVVMDWQKFEASDGVTQVSQNPHANAQRKQWFVRRRGGSIGTGGVGAVALRFDHGAVNFRDIVLPLLREFGFPASLAINPGADRLAMPENAGVTWEDYQSWAAVDGVEPWNHGMTHGGNAVFEILRREIVESLELLQAGIPNAAIEGWHPPGGAANYGGQNLTQDMDSMYGYLAGRMILASHAVSSGNGGSHLRPNTGHLMDGQRHFTIDGVRSLSTITNLIMEAQDTGAGVQLMLHPSQIGLPDMVSASFLRQLFQWIADERDAGRLLVLSPSALMLADQSHTHRYSLARFGDFRSHGARSWTDVWTNSTGWALQSGSGFNYVSTATGGVLSQDLRDVVVKQHRGALFEVSALVRAPSGGVARIGSSSLTGGTNDVTIPSGSGWRTIRKHVTMPLSGTDPFNISVGRVSGELQVARVRLRAA